MNKLEGELQTDTCLYLCADSSVFLNLLATGYIEEILKVCPYAFHVEPTVLAEISRHPIGGESAEDHVQSLISNDLIHASQLGDDGLELFLKIVADELAKSLGDGEAATIALASETNGIIAIDDQKATRICEHYSLKNAIVNTLDIISLDIVSKTLGDNLSDAVLNALTRARMRVSQDYENWVRELIGEELFQQCNSISLSARMRSP